MLGELEDLKAKVKENSRKELENLVRENRELSKKLESATGTSSSKGASVGGDKGGANRGPALVEGCTLTVEEAEDGFERVSLSPGRGMDGFTRYLLQLAPNLVVGGVPFYCLLRQTNGIHTITEGVKNIYMYVNGLRFSHGRTNPTKDTTTIAEQCFLSF